MADDQQDRDPRSLFLTEDIVIYILLRLPIASCIFRFRCVCRSWRILLSDPHFIRQILFFQTPADQRSLRILIAGGEDAPPRVRQTTHNPWLSYFTPRRPISAPPPRVRQTRYSLRSYDTLCPISAAAVGNSSSIPCKMRKYEWRDIHSTIVGCCHGIFCISNNAYLSSSVSDIILWNPTTSETKFLPPSSCPRHCYLRMCSEFMGFGFDPLTRNYKVVRTLKFQGIDQDDQDRAYTEVYSLRNDSWKRLFTDDDDTIFDGYPCEYVHHQQHQDTYGNERCYWFPLVGDGRNYQIISFDMSKEVFETMTVALPPNKSEWLARSCFMLKESFVVTFLSNECPTVDSYETWGLMKYGFGESWTKLFTFRLPGQMFRKNNLEIWKDGTHICAMRRYEESTSDYADDQMDGVHILNPATGGTNRLDLEGLTHPFQVHTYTPTRISLSDLVLHT